jgi:polyisoprenoid-binding protein YceI
MKKIAIAIYLLLFAFIANGQSLFSTKSGRVSFHSDAPLEDIEAVNNKVAAILNADNEELAVQMKIIDFEFSNKLMQEHFNENYLESEKYPTATFKGKFIEKLDLQKAGTYPATAKGTLTVHGVSKEVTIQGTIKSTGQELEAEFDFPIKLENHEIEIPSIVFQKIAEEVEVKGKFTLVKK